MFRKLAKNPFWIILSLLVTGVCLSVDLLRLSTTPPLLSDRLPTVPIVPTFGPFAVLADGTKISIHEIGTVGRFAGEKRFVSWTPRDRDLPDVQRFPKYTGSDGDLTPVPGFRYYRFLFKLTNPRPATDTPILVNEPAKFDPVSLNDYWRGSGGIDRLTSWLWFKASDRHASLLCGLPTPESAVVVADQPRQPWMGIARGLPIQWISTSRLRISLPKSQRPLATGIFHAQVVGFDWTGAERPLGEVRCNITPETTRIDVPTKTVPASIRTMQVRLTPYRCLRFTNIPLKPEGLTDEGG